MTEVAIYDHPECMQLAKDWADQNRRHRVEWHTKNIYLKLNRRVVEQSERQSERRVGRIGLRSILEFSHE